MSKLGGLIDTLDPFRKAVFGSAKGDKKKTPPPVTVVAKQGSEEEVTQRRIETANRLRAGRRLSTLPFGTATGEEERKSSLLGN